jgi:hypothetical protein
MGLRLADAIGVIWPQAVVQLSVAVMVYLQA